MPCTITNRDFDATTPLRIWIRNQAAIDTGGVLRQFYNDVFASLARNDEMSLFQGEARRRLPLFKNEHVITGLFEILGKMIAHSLVQQGPGFPYLAPVIYSYISTGDLQAALLKVSIIDVCDPILAGVIQKVSAFYTQAQFHAVSCVQSSRLNYYAITTLHCTITTPKMKQIIYMWTADLLNNYVQAAIAKKAQKMIYGSLGLKLTTFEVILITKIWHSGS